MFRSLSWRVLLFWSATTLLCRPPRPSRSYKPSTSNDNWSQIGCRRQSLMSGIPFSLPILLTKRNWNLYFNLSPRWRYMRITTGDGEFERLLIPLSRSSIGIGRKLVRLAFQIKNYQGIWQTTFISDDCCGCPLLVKYYRLQREIQSLRKGIFHLLSHSSLSWEDSDVDTIRVLWMMYNNAWQCMRVFSVLIVTSASKLKYQLSVYFWAT